MNGNSCIRSNETVFFQDRKKILGVQGFILKLVNNNCPELKTFMEGPRRDKRVNLTLVILVVPLAEGKLQIDEAFTAVTHEFSITGAGIVLDRQRALHEVVLGFRIGGDFIYVLAEAKHLSPMGGGFYHLGVEIREIVNVNDFPQLNKLSF
jgi:hypothetical protein